MSTTYDEYFAERVAAMSPQERATFEKAYADAGLAGDLAELVYKLRTAAGLTQIELAKRMGTTQNSISRLESGGSLPTIQLLDRLGKALNVRLSITADGADSSVHFGSAA